MLFTEKPETEQRMRRRDGQGTISCGEGSIGCLFGEEIGCVIMEPEQIIANLKRHTNPEKAEGMVGRKRAHFYLHYQVATNAKILLQVYSP